MLVADSTGGIKVVRGAVKQAQSSGAGIPTLLAMQKVCHSYKDLHMLHWGQDIAETCRLRNV